MNELYELYQELIVDHGRTPRNFGPMDDHTHQAQGFNPLCGDAIILRLKLENDLITDVKFEGNGCAISTASASMMSQIIKGKTQAETEALFEKFHDLVTVEDYEPDLDELGKLGAFAGVRNFPMRVKCATLAWHTVKAALNNAEEAATTE